LSTRGDFADNFSGGWVDNTDRTLLFAGDIKFSVGVSAFGDSGDSEGETCHFHNRGALAIGRVQDADRTLHALNGVCGIVDGIHFASGGIGGESGDKEGKQLRG